MPAMDEQDELRLLREEVAQLRERLFGVEEMIRAGSLPVASHGAFDVTRPETLSVTQPKVHSEEPAPDISTPARISQSPISVRPRSDAGNHAPEFRTVQVDTQADSLERRIGSQWLNRVGVVAVLVGVSYFLKLAFDSGWIGPGLRVLLGCVAGVGLCWWSERFRRPNSLAFSYSLKALGVGVLYLSLWASYQLYHLLPGAVAFLAMILVTAATAGLAIAQDAELLAGLALLGGLLTPVLCGTHENHEAALFCYLLLLAFGAFVLQRVKPWPRILFGAFTGTFLLGAAWFDSYYSDDQFAESLLFFTLLFALFAVVPLYALLEPERDRRTQQSGLLLAILNAAAYFAAVYSQLETWGESVQLHASAYAIGLAAVYAALAVALERRVSERPGVERLFPIAHYGLAISFLTIGIALKLHQHWITLAWLAEGALLFWAGSSTSRQKLKFFATVVVVMGLLRLIMFDLSQWGVQSAIFNARFATFAVAIAVLLWMAYLERGSADRRERATIAMAAVAVNLLALLAASLEIHDIFELQRRSLSAIPGAYRSLQILCSFSYSALIMLYGAGLMWLGFARNSALLRWQAIVLIAVTVIKVFLFDVSSLDHGWRVLSFIILGVLLLAVSYAYQRDWLGLQRPHAG
jgi:uncharacterized membrane protein